MVLCMHGLETCIRSLPGSSLGFGHQGIDPELGSRCCTEGWGCPESHGWAAEEKLGLVGCLHAGQEPFRGDVLSQSWLQRGFGPGLLSSSSALHGLLFPAQERVLLAGATGAELPAC